MRRSVKRPLIGAGLCLSALVLLAVAAYKIGPTSRLDDTLLLRIVRPEGSSPAHQVAEVIRLFGELPVVVVALAGVVLLGRHYGRRREAAAAVAVVVGAGITTQLLKLVFVYPRFQDVWWKNPQELAFPSGHTTAAAALSIALVLVVPPVHRMTAAAIGVLATGGVAISVVVLGWHYPSDALGGILVASAWGFAAVASLRFIDGRSGAVSASRPPRPRHLAVPTE
jgi:membrane-associated phospholipid phosphatase